MNSPLLVVGSGLRSPSLPGDVGYNLVANNEISIDGPGFFWIDIDARVKLPSGIWGLITGRSSAARLYGVGIVQGIIDNGYTGPLKVGVINYAGWVRIPAMTALAQLILMPAIVRPMEQVKYLPTTERGQAGWGSTG